MNNNTKSILITALREAEREMMRQVEANAKAAASKVSETGAAYFLGQQEAYTEAAEFFKDLMASLINKD